MIDASRLDDVAMGAIVRTIWGNEYRRFSDGWSPRSGAHWDRWTVYSTEEMKRSFVFYGFVVWNSLGGEDF